MFVKRLLVWVFASIALLVGLYCLLLTAYAIFNILTLAQNQQSTAVDSQAIPGFKLIVLSFGPAGLLLVLIVVARKLSPLVSFLGSVPQLP